MARTFANVTVSPQYSATMIIFKKGKKKKQEKSLSSLPSSYDCLLYSEAVLQQPWIAERAVMTRCQGKEQQSLAGQTTPK
jgi:hypothetical protein